MDGNNSKFTIEEHSMREIDVKRDTQHYQLPLCFWAYEIGAK